MHSVRHIYKETNKKESKIQKKKPINPELIANLRISDSMYYTISNTWQPWLNWPGI